MKILFLTFITLFSLNTFADLSDYVGQSKMRCEVIYESFPKIGNRKMLGKAAKQYRDKYKASGDLIILSSETNKIPLIAALDFPTNTITKIFEQGCEIKNSELLCEDYITDGERETSAFLKFNLSTKIINVNQNTSGKSSRISLESKVDGVCN
ncbi:hypothetical protein N9D96_02390 [Gammaproteobacteria bacterium]|nr:hypothetical protein [Gammaproteobacteria bacterium]